MNAWTRVTGSNVVYQDANFDSARISLRQRIHERRAHSARFEDVTHERDRLACASNRLEHGGIGFVPIDETIHAVAHQQRALRHAGDDSRQLDQARAVASEP